MSYNMFDYMSDMQKMLYSMEDSIKLRSRASAERRSREAEREQKEFREKLMRAAASEMELEGDISEFRGKQAAIQRDQLIGMMMAGF